MSNLTSENNIYEDDNISNYGSLSQEQINPPSWDAERKYRGAHTQKHYQTPISSITRTNSEVNYKSRDESNKLLPTSFENSLSNETTLIKKYAVPEKPLHLVPTHFILNACLDEVMLRVHNVLGQMSGISCEFLQSECEVINNDIISLI